MSLETRIREELDQLFELNRLFLGYLRCHRASEAEALGVPASCIEGLNRADDTRLEAAAAFPQSLFRLNLDRSAGAAFGPEVNLLEGDSARQALQLTVLLCAWNQSRQSEYAARLYLGLGSRQVRALRTAGLKQLAELALHRDLLACAYPGSEWFWAQLFQRQSAERRRKLVLLGLQPKLASSWAPQSFRALGLSV